MKAKEKKKAIEKHYKSCNQEKEKQFRTIHKSVQIEAERNAAIFK